MKTIEINLYKFDELSEEAQARAIRKYQSRDLFDWWSHIQYNAKECGVIIKSFDLYRNDIEIDFKGMAHDSAKALIYFWGEDTEIGEYSNSYLKKRDELYDKYNELSSLEDADYDKEEEDAWDEFHTNVCNYFLGQLRDEDEWLASEECAKDYFDSMDVHFTENGIEY